jgi:hypothetical protein
MAKRKDGPHWVKAWISDLSALTDKFRDLETGAVDFTALGKEEYKFRMALSRKDFTLSERARKVWDEAVGPYQQRVSAARKNPQDAPNGNAGGNMSDARNGAASKTPTSCDQFTADGDTREGSHDGKSGTSANIYATRQATTEGAANGNNADESATAPTVDDPATPEDWKSLVSASLSMAGTSNNEAAVTTKNQRQRRAGGSVREAVDPLPPARQRVTADVLTLAYSGEFGNVRLTQEQYAELGIKFGNQQKLNRAIDSLSCQIENGEKNPKNHYAELVKWASYREDMEEQKEEENAKPKLSKMEQSWINTFKAIERM